MSKKKAAAKHAGKKKHASKKGEKKEEKVSEKDLFLRKIADLEEKLQKENARLEELKIDLDFWKTRHKTEVETTEACVQHLQRTLRAETEKGMALQKQLNDASDARNLNEERARQQLTNIGRRKEEIKSMFLQQKLELEGKLAVLAELRRERNGLRTEMQRLETELINRRNEEREQSRDVDADRVRHLRLNRDEFRAGAVAVRLLFEEAFEHRLVAHAQALLVENVELRSRCRSATEHLLKTQDKHGDLTHLDATLKFECEVDAGIEARLKSDAEKSEVQIAELRRRLDATADAESAIQDEQSRLEGRLNRCQVVRTALNRSQENERSVKKLLKEQKDYLYHLQEKIDWQVNRNGFISSIVLRAADVLKGKKQRSKFESHQVGVDGDVLMRLKEILDIEPLDGELPE